MMKSLKSDARISSTDKQSAAKSNPVSPKNQQSRKISTMKVSEAMSSTEQINKKYGEVVQSLMLDTEILTNGIIVKTDRSNRNKETAR